MRITLEELRSEFAIDVNAPLVFNQITSGQRVPVIWKCPLGHVYSAKVHNKLKGTGCPYCNHKKPIPNETDFKTLYPQIADEWDYDTNGEKRPEHYLPHCDEYLSWVCKQGHKFQARMNNLVSNNSTCPLEVLQMRTSMDDFSQQSRQRYGVSRLQVLLC